ncbi:hypothetical protein [Actinacidiphila sp. bgisy145]|uniref:hypothetical protein n=1 Tax=Actinacidiphila sp. bgisy145 TaxID=3413792 RepID=UPI003EBD6957
MDDVLSGPGLTSDLSRLRLRFDSETSLVAMDADDEPAVLEWQCHAVLPLWEPEDEDAVADNIRLSVPDASLSRSSQGEREELTVFAMSGLTLDLGRIDRIYDSLDARSSDYEHFARLFDPSGDMGLHPDFEEGLIVGAHVVIIDRVRLAPAWRGHGGIGRLLIARSLRWLASSAALVATHPFPIEIPLDDRDDEQRVEREKASVQRTWQSLGFEPFREDLWVMKPHLRAHQDAAAQLEAAFSEYLV